jgi:hypothetical protein
MSHRPLTNTSSLKITAAYCTQTQKHANSLLKAQKEGLDPQQAKTQAYPWISMDRGRRLTREKGVRKEIIDECTTSLLFI